MIRGGTRTWRIGGPMLCVLAVIAAIAPATAFGQAAVDEYTLDIPGADGSNPSDPTAPTSASASGSGGGAGGTGAGGGKNGGSSGFGLASGIAGTASEGLNLADLQKGTGHAALPTSSRSAPEVVADTVTDSSMLPILAGLALITGLGAWRVLRARRRSLTGAHS